MVPRFMDYATRRHSLRGPLLLSRYSSTNYCPVKYNTDFCYIVLTISFKQLSRNLAKLYAIRVTTMKQTIIK